MKQPKLKIGQKVKCLVDESVYGTPIDITKEYKIDNIYKEDNLVCITNEITAYIVDPQQLQLITPKQKSKWKHSRRELKQVFANLPFWLDKKYTPEQGLKFIDMLMAKQSPDKEEVKQPIKSKEIEKLNNNQGVKLSGTVSGQRELLREYRNKINELIQEVNKLKDNK